MKKNAEFYLRRLAALQFPGSINNYSTRNPIHLLQEQTDERVDVDLNASMDYNKKDVEYYYEGDTYHSLDEIVAYELGIDLNDEESVRKYNQEHKNNLPFLSYEDATENNIEISCGELWGMSVDYPRDYLQAYFIKPEKVTATRRVEVFETKSIAFTHKGLEEEKDRISNHLFNTVQMYAMNSGNEEFTVLMQFLFEQGKALLDMDTVGLTIKNEEKADVRQMYRSIPNQEFCAYKCDFNVPAAASFNGQDTTATIHIVTSGEIKTCYGNEYPVGFSSVEFSMDGKNKTFRYPLECDGFLDDLNAKCLFNYARFI